MRAMNARDTMVWMAVAASWGCSPSGEPTTVNTTAVDVPRSSASTPSTPSTSAAPAPATSASAAAGDCEALFAPPAGAVKLCDEHVAAEGSEIHWQSYAHADDRHGLWTPYHERAGRCGASATFKPPLLSVAKEGKRLELFDAAGGGFPTCSKAPAATHKTVVIISEKHDR
jgi:hypothetical protein